jgi:hypothetical protein
VASPSAHPNVIREFPLTSTKALGVTRRYYPRYSRAKRLAGHPRMYRVAAEVEKSHISEYVDAEMHAIVSVVGRSGLVAMEALAGGNTAVSREAYSVRKAAAKIVESIERSVALFGEKAAALSRLAALATECMQADWDGADAAAIDPLAVLFARRFLRALPESLPLPEFAAEPDGSISLDWIRSRNRLFSLSVGRSNRLAYAWLDGADRGHGVARFDGQNVPARVLEGIKGILGQGID